MLKLYTNKLFLTQEYRSEVFPLLFDLHFVVNTTLQKYYCLVDSVLESDYVVMPINYLRFKTHKAAFNELQNEARQFNKIMWVYTAGDYGFTIREPNTITFRLGGFKSKLPKSTIILPSFINDPYQKLDVDFLALSKSDKPQLGFVGHADSSWLKCVKEFLLFIKRNFKRKQLVGDYQNFYPSGYKRAKYLKEIISDSTIKATFIFRNKYRAGAKNDMLKQKTTLEFYKNMFENPYTFCMRGEGNFSVRFYETIAMGRIPVLLDTDCKLPLDDTINWNNHCVSVYAKHKKSIANQIIDFHNTISEKDFENMQVNNRHLWLKVLNRASFFIEIYKKFRNKVEVNA